jgi:hypothetical protein
MSARDIHISGIRPLPRASGLSFTRQKAHFDFRLPP